MAEFLHERRDFSQLVAIVAERRGIDPVLVEKDYWIMHCLWGLQAQKFRFELKGGTSLSKGFGVIHRFSEDIDIRVEPPEHMQVKIGRNQDKPAHIASRRDFYDWLSGQFAFPASSVWSAIPSSTTTRCAVQASACFIRAAIQHWLD
jgi:hypothetical protein